MYVCVYVWDVIVEVRVNISVGRMSANSHLLTRLREELGYRDWGVVGSEWRKAVVGHELSEE